MSAEVAWNDPDEHQFFVPDLTQWAAIEKMATNIGEALNTACAALKNRTARAKGCSGRD